MVIEKKIVGDYFFTLIFILCSGQSLRSVELMQVSQSLRGILHSNKFTSLT